MGWDGRLNIKFVNYLSKPRLVVHAYETCGRGGCSRDQCACAVRGGPTIEVGVRYDHIQEQLCLLDVVTNSGSVRVEQLARALTAAALRRPRMEQAGQGLQKMLGKHTAGNVTHDSSRSGC